MGKTIAFIGPGPHKLAKYETQDYCWLCEGFLRDLVIRRHMEGTDAFLSGGDPGFPQVAFWAVHHARRVHADIRNELVVPWPDYDAAWPTDGPFGKRNYRTMLQCATHVEYFLDGPPKTAWPRASADAALRRRNLALIEMADEIVAMYNGDYRDDRRSGTAELLRIAEDTGRTVTLVGYRLEHGTGLNAWLRR